MPQLDRGVPYLSEELNRLYQEARRCYDSMLSSSHSVVDSFKLSLASAGVQSDFLSSAKALRQTANDFLFLAARLGIDTHGYPDSLESRAHMLSWHLESYRDRTHIIEESQGVVLEMSKILSKTRSPSPGTTPDTQSVMGRRRATE